MKTLIWRIRYTLEGIRFMGVKYIFMWWAWSEEACINGGDPEDAADYEIENMYS